jgi:hypothetical protein
VKAWIDFVNELSSFTCFKMIPSLTLPFLRGGNSVELGSTVSPPLKKGRVREGIKKPPDRSE